ncbi:Hypothetical protein, putative [Bodo saltans]|uniref:Trichohyalin-plectin-homology domain-containing protein n=1 Tax=Bodo saltans TaxID=75058 RepID=A0A0S4JJF1_BODSA|nr:Hypothetical protein, putative [Bodo saltans]|eukprot:CUG91616.1 Hypothetical protein, putative [Bodo saltans]
MDDRTMDAMLAEIEARLPSLQHCSRDVHPTIVVGRGSCGLGQRYHAAVQQTVRQSQLREWVVDAERRSGSQGRDLAAIGEAQRNALLMAKIRKEEKMMDEMDARRRQKLHEKRWVREQMENNAKQMRQDRQDAEELAQWQRSLVQYERDLQADRDAEQREVEEYNSAMIEESKSIEESIRLAAQSRLREAIHQGRQAVRDMRKETTMARQAAAKAEMERCRKAEAKRAATKQKELLELKKDARQQREDHKYRFQDAKYRLEEEAYKAREIARTAPNADAITMKHANALDAKKARLKEEREHLSVRRSVSSFL